MKLTYTRKNGETFEFDPDDREELLTVADLMQEDENPQGDLVILRNQLNALLAKDEGNSVEARRIERAISKVRKVIRHRLSQGAIFDDFILWTDHLGLIKLYGLHMNYETVDRILKHPVSQCTRTLGFRSGSPVTLQEILDYEKFQQIVELDLTGAVGNKVAHILASSKNLVNLRELELGKNDIDFFGVESLGFSNLISQLRHLGLRENNIGTNGARCLAVSRNMSELRSLNLSGNWIRDEGVSELVASPFLWNLSSLLLADTNIHDAGAFDLAYCYGLRTLEHLDLSANNIGPYGARALAASTRLPRLKSLSLHGNPIYSSDMSVFLNREGLPSLEYLSYMCPGGPMPKRMQFEFQNQGINAEYISL